jgi:tetratricopeptide (TPR) repeat protein
MKKLYIFLFTAFPLLLSAQSTNSSPLIDSILQELPLAKNDTNKVKSLDLLSFTYAKVDPDAGLKYAAQAKELSEKLEWKKGIASAWSDMGINYEAKSDHAKAIANDLKALDLYETLGQKQSMAGVLANISLVYLAQANYSKALDYSFRALKLNEEITDQKTSAIIQENIGIIYMEQGKHDVAMDYYSKALTINETLGDEDGIARLRGNIGIIYDANGDYQKALEYHIKALEANTKTGKKIAMQINLANIGNAYSHLNDFSKALQYHMQALRISQELGLKKDIAVNLGNIGETYFFIAKDTSGTIQPDSLIHNSREENIHAAISYLEQATTLCREINFVGPLIEFRQYLSKAYFLSGDYKKAYETFEIYTANKDSVFSVQGDIKLKDLETRRELDMKDKEIIIQNKQIEIGNLAASNKRKERALFISGIVLLLLIITVVIRGFIKRSKAQEDALSDIASIQSHEIRGPVARILGLSKLFNKNNPADPMNKELIQHISNATLELDEVVKKIVKKTVV